jgi:4-hydroxy-tetrahydrodipicolinate synthase
MLDGDLAKAMELQIRYLGLINDLFIEVNPIPVKEAMNLMGMNVGPCRLPLYEMADNNRDALRAELVKHGLVK